MSFLFFSQKTSLTTASTFLDFFYSGLASRDFSGPFTSASVFLKFLRRESAILSSFHSKEPLEFLYMIYSIKYSVFYTGVISKF